MLRLFITAKRSLPGNQGGRLLTPSRCGTSRSVVAENQAFNTRSTQSVGLWRQFAGTPGHPETLIDQVACQLTRTRKDA